MAVTTFVQANSCQIFSNQSGNSYSCSLPVSGSGQPVTSCTFTFDSVTCPSVLYCNLQGNSSSCNVGTCQKGSNNTWNCTLDSNCLSYLNNCLGSGNNCTFSLDCWGKWNIGSCQCDYTCAYAPQQRSGHVHDGRVSRPDVAGYGTFRAAGSFRRGSRNDHCMTGSNRQLSVAGFFYGENFETELYKHRFWNIIF